jgi:hypothetical protein
MRQLQLFVGLSGCFAWCKSHTVLSEAVITTEVETGGGVSTSCIRVSLRKSYVPADESTGGFTRGTQWLMWRFETDTTLSEALDGLLGPFPARIADFFVRNSDSMDEEKRDAKVCPVDNNRTNALLFWLRCHFCFARMHEMHAVTC